MVVATGPFGDKRKTRLIKLRCVSSSSIENDGGQLSVISFAVGRSSGVR